MDSKNTPSNNQAGPGAPQSLPPQPPTHAKPRHKKTIIKELLSTAGILGAAFAIALLLIAFVFQSYAVDGPSMQQTLHNNDRLIVWKVPRTWARITHHNYIPKRGDVIVFQQSGLAEFGQDNQRQLIKRVIGLPGDRVVVKNGSIKIYNQENPQGFDPDQTLPYGENNAIPYTGGNIDVTLDEDELFVCGDNRPDSLDSRSFGPIKADQVVGKLIARILPLKDAERF